MSCGRLRWCEHRSRGLALLAIAFACASGGEDGCVVPTPAPNISSLEFDVSAAVALPRGVPGKLDESGEAELKLPAFKLRVSALDITLTGGTDSSGEHFEYETVLEPIPSLMLLLVFEPSWLGLSFDPTQAWIETDDGRALSPLSYVGPGQLEVVREHEQGCVAEVDTSQRVLELPRRTEARSWPLPLGRTCFVLAFQARVTPPRGVSVNLHGLQNAGRPMPIPGMRFLRRPARAKYLTVRPEMLP